MEIMATVSFRTFSAVKVVEMLDAGAHVLRYNAAHGSHDELLERLAIARRSIDQMPSSSPRPKLLIDIPGSKTRTGPLDGGSLHVIRGDEYELVFANQTRSRRDAISLPSLSMPSDLQQGDVILVGDGEVAFTINQMGNGFATVTALVGGAFNQGESIAFPNKPTRLPRAAVLSEPLVAILNTIRPEYIALSFVNTPEEIELARRAVSQLLKFTPNLMAKIETSEGLANIDAIVRSSDSIMVGRGDLALFSPYEELFLSQNLCIDAASRHDKQCWVATQLLDSAAISFVPSRSNICDVGYLASRRVHGLVLSRETGLADRPGHVISVAKKIIDATIRRL